MIVGAGYDGRALRYGGPGIRWWEVDRAGTQTDKRARLARLGIATDAVGLESRMDATWREMDVGSTNVALHRCRSKHSVDTERNGKGRVRG